MAQPKPHSAAGNRNYASSSWRASARCKSCPGPFACSSSRQIPSTQRPNSSASCLLTYDLIDIGLKARCGNRQRIDGGQQSREYEVPLVAGCNDSLPARLGLDRCYGGRRHRSAGWIGDRSADTSVALAVKARGGKSHEHQCDHRQSDVKAAFSASCEHVSPSITAGPKPLV